MRLYSRLVIVAPRSTLRPLDCRLTVQTSDPSVGPNATDLLSAAYQLAAVVNQALWLGASRDPSSPATQGWSWVDGTNASNINCGAASCGPWALSEPKYVHFGKRIHNVSSYFLRFFTHVPYHLYAVTLGWWKIR